MTDAERRRYFRIEDHMAIRYEPLTEEEAARRAQSLQGADYQSLNHLQLAERQLQLLIDKLRVQQPDFAQAIELLNSKFNLLKADNPNLSESALNTSVVRRVDVSACGIAFEDEYAWQVGQHLLMDITLLPSDLHVQTLGVIVGRQQATGNLYTVRIEFYGMNSEDEELLVQHIVKRQGRLLSARRRPDDQA